VTVVPMIESKPLVLLQVKQDFQFQEFDTHNPDVICMEPWLSEEIRNA